VKSGREGEFVAAWHAFAEWSRSTIQGASWATLLRDRARPDRFVSVGPWDNLEAIEAWRSHPGFAERIDRLRGLIDSLEPMTLDMVVELV
jgi:heme-degrading monooxygenase HmoA